MDEIIQILKRGIPVNQTPQTKRDIEILKRFYRQKTGKSIPCGWCNRGVLWKACKKIAGV